MLGTGGGRQAGTRGASNVCRVSVGLGPAHLPAAPLRGSWHFNPSFTRGWRFGAAWARLAAGQRGAQWANDLTLAAVSAQLLGVRVRPPPSILLPLWLSSLSLGLPAERSWGQGPGRGSGQCAGRWDGGGGTAFPAAFPGLPGGTAVSGLREPPSRCSDGGGGSWEGLHRRRRVRSRCERAQHPAAGLEAQGRGGPRSGSAPRPGGRRPGGAAQRQRLRSSRLFCGVFPASSLWKR